MKQFLFIAAMLMPFVVWAQPNYHEGYVIKINGDTLKGFINYRDWVYSPEYVEFKTDRTNEQASKFTPDSISGFGVYGFEAYKSYVGDITMNKNIFPNISTGLDTTHQVKAIFLKPIRQGTNLDLYYNRETNKDRFFIAEKGGRPTELKYYEYYTSGSEEAFANVYKTQLQVWAAKYANGNKKLIKDLESARYELQYIKNIVDEINGVDPVLQQKADSVKAANSPSSFRILVGAAANYTVYRSPNSTTFSPKITAGVDFFFNPNVQQLILRIELGYASATNPQFTQTSISVNPQIVVNVYNTDRFKYYVDAGASLNFSSYNVSGLTPFWVAVPFQTGVVLNHRWELFVSYAFKSQYLGLSYSNTNQSTCVGVKLLL